MSGDPVPSKLVFLSDLDSFPTETKVRFLGWYVVLLSFFTPP